LEIPTDPQTISAGGTVYANGTWDFGSKEGSNRVHRLVNSSISNHIHRKIPAGACSGGGRESRISA
jgi:hypothetical protein